MPRRRLPPFPEDLASHMPGRWSSQPESPQDSYFQGREYWLLLSWEAPNNRLHSRTARQRSSAPSSPSAPPLPTASETPESLFRGFRGCGRYRSAAGQCPACFVTPGTPALWLAPRSPATRSSRSARLVAAKVEGRDVDHVHRIELRAEDAYRLGELPRSTPLRPLFRWTHGTGVDNLQPVRIGIAFVRASIQA